MNREEGSTSLELAILTPVVLALLVLAIVAGRLVTAHTAVDHAATAAARAASLARTASAAQTAARTTTTGILAEQDLRCTDRSVQVDTAAFAARLGRSAPVQVSLSCTVPLSALGIGSHTVHSTFTSPLDPFRGRL